MDVGVRNYVVGWRNSDAGDDVAGIHYECRRCGRNLERDHEQYPACGGDVAGHLL